MHGLPDVVETKISILLQHVVVYGREVVQYNFSLFEWLYLDFFLINFRFAYQVSLLIEDKKAFDPVHGSLAVFAH